MAKQVLSNLDFANVAKIINLPNATNPQEPVTLSQMNSAVEGLSWKDSCRAGSSANINLSAPGATIGGVTMVLNDRILLRGQTTQSQNGIYIFNGSAVALTRALDANTSDELEQAIVTVEEGTDAGTTWRQTSVNFVLDTGNVVWTAFGVVSPAASEATAGIAEIATQAETDAGTDDLRIVTPLKLATYANRKFKLSQNIGDGAATQYTVTHNFNTRDVQVEVYRNSGSFDTIMVDIDRISVNAVNITFASAPALNAFRVVVLG